MKHTSGSLGEVGGVWGVGCRGKSMSKGDFGVPQTKEPDRLLKTTHPTFKEKNKNIADRLSERAKQIYPPRWCPVGQVHSGTGERMGSHVFSSVTQQIFPTLCQALFWAPRRSTGKRRSTCWGSVSVPVGEGHG